MTDALARLQAALADRYTIEHELGAGGMAIVYLAEDLKHHRRVAIKVLRSELAAALGPDRFLREIETTASLRHPHILPLYDSGEAGGFLYYVMPYVEGESLRDRLVREKQLPLDDALQIAREVADALGYAHERGLIHRDIKPENILLERGHATVADFGIARAVSAAGRDRLTQTGVAVGTPSYMSPEQAAGAQDLDGRNDLYALGCVVYEMLAGQPPYTGPTAQAIMAKRITDPVPPLRTVRDFLPHGLEEAIQQALAKAPADRFATLAEFATALARSGATARVSRPRSRTAWRSAVVALMAVLGGAGGLAAVRMLRDRRFTFTTVNAIPLTTEPGIEYQPALSPDGRQVAFVVGEDIVVRGIAVAGGGGEVRLTDAIEGSALYPAWSPDGEAVRFWHCVRGVCSWKEIGRLGGAARALDVPAQRATLAWSPDGSHAAFVVLDSIFVYQAADRSTRLLAVHPRGWDPHSLTWSPDGHWIAFVNGNPFWRDGPNVANSSIWLVAAGDGERVAVTPENSLNVSPAWVDAHHLLFVSDHGGQREVYVVDVGPKGVRGEPSKVPGGTDAHSISTSADGSRLAFAKFRIQQNIRAYSVRGSGPTSIRDGEPITTGTQMVETHDVSPDGQWLLYDASLGRRTGIFRVRLGSSEPVLRVVESGASPRWAPNGREITFHEMKDSSPEIWVVSAEGGAPAPLTDSPSTDLYPIWSPDGRHIAFWSNRTGRFEVWLLSRDRIGAPWGPPVQLTDFGCAALAWVPDGSGVLCRDLDVKTLVVVSPSGSVLWRHALTEDGLWTLPVYSDDGGTLYGQAVRRGRDGIWAWPRAGGSPRLVVAFDDARLQAMTYIGAVNVRRDRVFMTVAEHESDIWATDLERR